MNETYKRQIALIGEDKQRKLDKSIVTIVGAGGIGNIAAKYLASSGVGMIHIFDSDKVEKSNLNRQLLFNTEVIGKNKAISLSNTIGKINPEISCTGFSEQFKKPHDLKYCDLVLDCTDNLESSYFIESEALREGIPMVFAKTSKYSGVVTVIKDKAYLHNNYPTKQLNKDHSVFPTIGGIVGSYQASLALKLLIGLPVTNDVVYFDVLNDEIRKFNKEKL